MTQYIIYALLDTSRPINLTLGEFIFDYVPIYIGRGIRLSRPYTHIRRALNGDTRTKIRAKVKQLVDSGVEVRPVCLKTQLNKKAADDIEVDLIFKLKRVNEGGTLYNVCDGGDGGDTFTNNINKEEIRKKLMGRMPWNKGLTKNTDDVVRSVSIKNKNNLINGNLVAPSFKGRKHSQETIDKLSNMRIGVKLGKYKPRVSLKKYILTSPTGETIISNGQKEFYNLLTNMNLSIYKLKLGKHVGWTLTTN
jgi:hypothetical protein